MSKIKSIPAFVALLLCGGAWAAPPSTKCCCSGWFDFLSLSVSCVAAFVAWRTFVAAKKIAGATYVANAFQRYWQPNMLHAIRKLENYQKKNPVKGATGRAADGRICAACWSWDGIVCDAERRIVKGFFNDAWRARKLDIITDAELKEICSVDAYKLYHEIIEPMEAIKNKDYNPESFVELKKIIK